MPIPGYISAHRRAAQHRQEVLTSTQCGCFHCCKVFKPAEIVRWKDVEKGVGQTALCPKCGTDTVIGDKSGHPVTERFLKKMNRYWF